MIRKILLITTAGIILIINSCNECVLGPGNIEPGRRDYVWTVDTIPNYSYMSKLWGSSPTNVWAIGQPGDFSKSIWHYDGNQWTTDDVLRLIIPHSIYGFASNNVWMGGSDGKIWHYDGTGWQQSVKLTKDGSTLIAFDNMWGDSQNDLFASGAYSDENHLYNNSVITHYSENNWVMLNTYGLIGIVERLYKNNIDGSYYLRTNRIGGGEYPDSTLIYKYTNNKYYKIYGSLWTKGSQADISLINGEVYFVLGNEIAKRTNNQFQTLLKVDNPNFYQCIWGRTSKDIFLFMTDGLVHYNGTDMEYLLHFDKPRTQIYSAMLFNEEVFFLVYESSTGTYLIYHGKLNNGG